MSSRDQLRDELNARSKKGKADWMVELASRKGLDVADLFEITFDGEQTIAFRAAWVLEYIFTEYPATFRPVTQLFIEKYPLQTNPSCQRHYTKIMMVMSAGDYLKPEQQEEIIEATFGWLIDPDTPVAVQVNCMDILFNMSKRHDWIAEELIQQINFLLKTGSAAMQSRGKRILNKLKKK